MLSPPLLPCQHRIIPDMQISPGSNQYNVMRQLQKQFSGNPPTSLLHTDYQPWLKDAVSRADDKSPYLGKVSSAYILGAAAQRNLCFTGSVIHDVPHKTFDDTQKLCMPHNHAGSACKACFPRPQLPVSVDLSAPFIPPSTMSVSPARSPQRSLQTDFQYPATECHMNSRLYDVSPPVETTELSLWSMRSHRYQPYPHHMPPRSTFSHPQGSTYMPHLLPPSPEQSPHFSPVNQCNFVGGFPSSASVHHAALLALGDRLNASSTITRRCARCRCPNCLSPTELRNANGKKEHICHFPNCGKVYGKTSHLKAHIRWHLGERPFVCNWLFCGKSFTRSDELQRHLRTHTGEKKFQCQICEKKFMRSDHLSKHVKIHQKKVQSSSPEKEPKDLSSEVENTEKKTKETTK